MKENNVKVIKILVEFGEECTYIAKALVTAEKDVISTLGKKLKEFLSDNSLIGGVMDKDNNLYEFELIFKTTESEVASPKRISTYMIEFLEFIKKDFVLDVENNFDGLELTSNEFEKLLK